MILNKLYLGSKLCDYLCFVQNRNEISLVCDYGEFPYKAKCSSSSCGPIKIPARSLKCSRFLILNIAPSCTGALALNLWGVWVFCVDANVWFSLKAHWSLVLLILRFLAPVFHSLFKTHTVCLPVDHLEIDKNKRWVTEGPWKIVQFVHKDFRIVYHFSWKGYKIQFTNWSATVITEINRGLHINDRFLNTNPEAL